MALKTFLNGRFKPIKLKTAMVLIITISLSITSAAIAIMLLRSHKVLLEKRSIETIKDSLSVASTNINTYINTEVESLSSIISNDRNFIELLNENRDSSFRESLIITYLLNAMLQEKTTSTTQMSPYIVLENKKGRIFNLSYPIHIESKELEEFIDKKAVTQKDRYYGNFLEPVPSSIFTGISDNKMVIPYVQNIIEFTPYSYEGKIIEAIPESTLAKLISSNSLSQHGVILIVSPHGNIITCSDKSREEQLAHWKNIEPFINDTYHIDTNTKKVSVALTDSKTGWTYVSISDFHTIYGTIYKELAIYIILTILIIGVAIYIVLIISKHINEPFENLKNSMKNVIKTRNFSTKLEQRGPSDIREITEAYNILCSDMNHLIWNKYELQRQIQLAEFDALVTQINPHFLANTLDSIVWKAYMANAPEIAEMVARLGELFNLALNNGNTMTSLANEIHHAKSYIKLQNCRYDGKIKLSILDNTGEDIEDISIPKLIIQPVIENSLKHGFKSTMSSFSITIALENRNGFLEILISDTGTGMDEETLNRTKAKLLRRADYYDHIKAKHNFNKGEGVGMVNVNQRLRLYYGKDSGLSIHSTGNKGTVISLKLPLNLTESNF